MPPVRTARSLRDTIDGTFEGLQYMPYYRDTPKELAREPPPDVTPPADPRPPALRLRDLDCIRTLGSGQDGQVLLVCTTRDTHPLDVPGSLFALKVFKRRVIRCLDACDHQKKNVERSILSELAWHPFVTGIVDAFYDWRNLYLLLEFIPRGTLRSLIQKHAPMDPTTSAFYFANIVTALAYLEEHDILHRDLKPENILIGADGYLSLADFGTAVDEDQHASYLLVGTPPYMAPEIHGSHAGFYFSVDWWSAGCVLYEMTTRKLPFYGKSLSRTFKKTSRGKIHWPKNISIGTNLKSLISGLLTVEAESRLGYKGVADVMKHPWLATVDWNKIRLREYIAPHIPGGRDQDLTHVWHSEPLPGQSRLPGVKIAPVPAHLTYDDRFPEKPQI